MVQGEIIQWQTVNGPTQGEVLGGDAYNGYLVRTAAGRVVILGGTRYHRDKEPTTRKTKI